MDLEDAVHGRSINDWSYPRCSDDDNPFRNIDQSLLTGNGAFRLSIIQSGSHLNCIPVIGSVDGRLYTGIIIGWKTARPHSKNCCVADKWQ